MMMPKSIARDSYFSRSAFVMGCLLSGASPTLVMGEVGVWQGVRGKPHPHWSQARWVCGGVCEENLACVGHGRGGWRGGRRQTHGRDIEFELGLKIFSCAGKHF